jgi:Immunoglobulin I-set domain/Beta-propeller repeat
MTNTTAVPASSNSPPATPVNFKMTRCAKIILPALVCLALTAPAQTVTPLAGAPLYFEANRSQASHAAAFVARGGDYQFSISPGGMQLVLRKAAARARGATLPAPEKITARAVRMQFVGANPRALIRGDEALAGKINYLIGRDPAQWRAGVPIFAKVRVAQLYPGVNLVYYGNQRQLEYDFTVAPKTDPRKIVIHFGGADDVFIDPQGGLVLKLGADEIRQPAPVIYQTAGGARKKIAGGYKMLNRDTVSFWIGQYDRDLPLVIDPALGFATYFGGNSSDTGWSIAVDTNGFIYVTGNTLSSQFVTPGSLQTNFQGGASTGDAFVAKFGQGGTNLIYLTYLGGSGDDLAAGVAVDGAGNAYITGYTDSTNFPNVHALYPKIGGTLNPHVGVFPVDAFVAELDAGGSNLLYSTYLGGAGTDAGTAIAVDASDNAYITGFTGSTNFPVSTNAWQKQLASPNFTFNGNAFVAEIGSGGTNLIYSSYFGGTNFDEGAGIAVDAGGNVYVTGFTDSTNFPTTTNALVSSLNGLTNNNTFAYDAFAAKFAPSCTNLLYSTFLGGVGDDVGYAVAADAGGNAYVAGFTDSTNFPNTATNVPGLYSSVATNIYGYLVTNAFLTKISPDGSAIGYSAVFGGYVRDIAYGLAVDPTGNAFVVGATTSTNFPAFNTAGPLCATNSGGSDVFVTAFNTNASALLYSAYLGGASDDFGYGIALDSLDNAYLVGQTSSTNFPTFAAGQTALDGTSDVFVAEIILNPVPPMITTQPTNQSVAAGQSVAFTVTAIGTPPLNYQWQRDGTNLVDGVNTNGATISGATNATLVIYNAQTNDSGNYAVILTNYGGSTTSSVVALTVTNAFPLITAQPVSQTIEVGAGSVGGYVSFSISESAGTPPETYQWVKDGTNLVNGGTNFPGAAYPFHIYGATNAALYIVDPQTNDEGAYWLVITNPAGVVTSSNAALTVVSFPTIVTPPTNQTVGLGSTVTFVVNAVGTATLGYQWLYNGAALMDGTNADGSIISDSTSTALTITNAQMTDDGGYSVIVTNGLGSVTSSPPAVLTVLPSPRFSSIAPAGGSGGFIFSGVGGTNDGAYSVLTSTNLLTPLALWTPIATNQFGNQGQFIFTNTAPTNTPQLFYILQMQSP